MAYSNTGKGQWAQWGFAWMLRWSWINSVTIETRPWIYERLTASDLANISVKQAGTDVHCTHYITANICVENVDYHGGSSQTTGRSPILVCFKYVFMFQYRDLHEKMLIANSLSQCLSLAAEAQILGCIYRQRAWQGLILNLWMFHWSVVTHEWMQFGTVYKNEAVQVTWDIELELLASQLERIRSQLDGIGVQILSWDSRTLLSNKGVAVWRWLDQWQEHYKGIQVYRCRNCDSNNCYCHLSSSALRVYTVVRTPNSDWSSWMTLLQYSSWYYVMACNIGIRKLICWLDCCKKAQG